MLRVRGLTQAWLATHVPAVALTEQQDLPEADLWRRVRGTIEVPLFLESDQPGAGLHRGADGLIEQNGTMLIPFLGQVPLVLRDVAGAGHRAGLRPRRVQHPRRGALAEPARHRHARARGALLHRLVGHVARRHRAPRSTRWPTSPRGRWPSPIACSRAWRTRSSSARPSPGPCARCRRSRTPRAHRSTRRSRRASWASARATSSRGMLAAVHPGLTRIGLNAGGAGLSHALSRSRPLSDIFLLLDMKDPLDRRRFESMLQPYFDRIDGAFWSRYVLREPLPGNAPRRILMQTGLGDPEVPNLAAFLHARAAGPQATAAQRAPGVRARAGERAHHGVGRGALRPGRRPARGLRPGAAVPDGQRGARGRAARFSRRCSSSARSSASRTRR